MHSIVRTGVLLSLAMAMATVAGATTIEGGGSKRRDCLVQVMVDGVGFPSGASRFKGATCTDGDACDADGLANGRCQFLALWCLNQTSEALPQCAPPASVEAITVSGKVGKGRNNRLDTTDIDLAIGALGLPSSDAACTTPVAIEIPVEGPTNSGEYRPGRAKLKAKSSTSKGKDKDRYQLVCLPGAGVGASTTTTTSTIPGSTTTTTTTLPTFGRPDAGLNATIVAAAADTEGTVTVDFTLTDDDGVALIPTSSSTDDPDEARVRVTIARLEVVTATSGSVTTDFTKYVNYITRTVSGGGRTTNQPTYDSGGSFELLDLATGLWRYTFGTHLPMGYPAGLTHTIGAQIEREFEGTDLVANPVFDFVPDGSPVTSIREVTTTAQCNGCHDPLALHGGGRREVHLCQLCHTDQAIDPESGNTIDLKHMIHRIHSGKENPAIEDGPVGTKYEIIGFGGSEHVFGAKVNVCVGGTSASAPCDDDADCPGGGTCTGEATAGVGFPRDLRDCGVCHSEGATSQNAMERPNVLACTGCHSDRNPGNTAWEFLPAPGVNHPGPGHSEALCNECHRSTIQDGEFDLSVPGGHVIEARSEQLLGLHGEILSATGAPNGPLMIDFRITQNDGLPLASLAGLNRVALASSGPGTDFGGSSLPLLTATIAGNGASGTLTGPDANGVFSYTSATNLPADAAGTWRVGLEARRPVTLPDPDGPSPTRSVNEAMQNPVFDFSVDGSTVTPRRTVVDIENCGSCHGVFSETFGIHGNLRNQTDYCVICHNPSVSDFARRSVAVTMDGANPVNESIHFKRLIHKLHTGEELEAKPYIVYGFGSAGFTAHDFSEIRFPGNRANCETCHVDDSYELPLPSGVSPTAVTEVDTSGPTPVEVKTGEIQPIQAACLACHSGEDAAAHAATMTTAAGAEACTVCHGEGSSEAVSVVHARE